MTNEELVELVQKGVDVEKNLGQLYEQNKGFIYNVCKPFMNYTDIEDLQQEAWMGFQKAIFDFKTDKDAKLTTYATWKIRSACIRYIQSDSAKRLPVHIQQRIWNYKNFVKKYQNQYQEEPSDEEITAALDITFRQLKQVRKVIAEDNCSSLDAMIKGTDEFSLLDMLADETDIAEDVERKMQQDYEHQVIMDAMDEKLNDKEKEIINDRFFSDRKVLHEDIAKKMNLSTSRIGDLEKTALKKLKKSDKLQELMEEKYGYDCMQAFHTGLKTCLDRRTSSTEIIALNRVMMEEKQKKVQKELDKFFDELFG